jgi:hypothetical protein
MVSTKNPDGTWNVRPYQLALPYRVDETPQIILSTQVGSRTFRNLRNTLSATFSYLEHNDDDMETISFLGNHFNNHEDRDARVPWLVDDSGVLVGSFQSVVCELDHYTTTQIAAYSVLNITQFNSPTVEHPLMSTTYGLRGRQHIFAPAPVTSRVDIEIPANSEAFGKIMAARKARESLDTSAEV